jgi:hypothetical protein
MGTKMKKQLFTKTSIFENTATVGGYNNTRYQYINGYYEAGYELVNIAISELHGTYKKDILFYPICYSYRHYLELHLKSLIKDTEILYDKMDQLGYLKNGTLSEKISDNLDNIHNINTLFELFYKRLNLVSDEKFPDDIKKYIKQMHDMDTNGQKFRYYIDKNKNINFLQYEQFDIKNISDIMKEVNSLLWGVDGWLDYHINMSDSIMSDISEYEEDMSEYYY